MSEASEAIFLDKVKTLALMNGWLYFHPEVHQLKTGHYRSDGKGFPDLVLAHKNRGLIFAELKTEQGRMTPAQKTWALALSAHGEYHLWRPNQLDQIARRLGAPK